MPNCQIIGCKQSAEPGCMIQAKAKIARTFSIPVCLFHYEQSNKAGQAKKITGGKIHE